MCCDNKVSFGVKNLTDMVVAENGVSIPSVNINAYIASKGQGDFWKENSRFGYTGICTNLPFGSDLVLTLNDGVGNYDSPALGFFGGHPIHRPPTA